MHQLLRGGSQECQNTLMQKMHVSPFFVWVFGADMHEITEANLLTSVSCLLIWTLVSALDVDVGSGAGETAPLNNIPRMNLTLYHLITTCRD